MYGYIQVCLLASGELVIFYAERPGQLAARQVFPEPIAANTYLQVLVNKFQAELEEARAEDRKPGPTRSAGSGNHQRRAARQRRKR